VEDDEVVDSPKAKKIRQIPGKATAKRKKPEPKPPAAKKKAAAKAKKSA